MFKNMTTDNMEQAQDRLGGFDRFETDIYEARIINAYAGKSDKGAQNVTVVARLLDSGKEYRETIYITNRDGQHWFMNGDSKVPLPGFTTINDLCIATTEKPLADQDTEEKQVKIYDGDLKKEVPKAAQVLIDLINKSCWLAIEKVLENKNEKGDDNTYVPTAETRISNTIAKVFEHNTKMTIPEAVNGKESAEFFEKWLEKNKGKEVDRRKIKDGQSGSTGAPPKAGQTEAKPKTASIFGKKG